MNERYSSAQVTLTLDLDWTRHGVLHHEHFFIPKLNTWRDLDPSSLLNPVLDLENGESLDIRVSPEQLAGKYDPGRVKTVRPARIGIDRQDIVPGRFYPQGLISGIPGVFRGNVNPFRLLDCDGQRAVVDLNHPLAGTPVDLQITVVEEKLRGQERGGGCMDWIQAAIDGPGMQQRIKPGQATVFTGVNGTGDGPGRAMSRQDERPDSQFYQTDRFVPHIDRTASRQLSKIYGRIINPGTTVLDLMAGWASHLQDAFAAGTVHGLGMNANELAANPVLSGTVVQDLNENAHLPYGDNTFDAVICSLSVEYLIRPVEVFEQVARVLRPGGIFAVSFSNRWFPEKAISIWKDLHDFERMGMVLEYFYGAQCFEALETYSVRGYPRPFDDVYADQMLWSDPVYVVTGLKK